MKLEYVEKISTIVLQLIFLSNHLSGPRSPALDLSETWASISMELFGCTMNTNTFLVTVVPLSETFYVEFGNHILGGLHFHITNVFQGWVE